MKIVDVWNQNNDVFAYCIGDAINHNFSCKEISIDGATFAVAAFDILTALNGSISAVLKISGRSAKEIPHGQFNIVN